ncbi:hypothetical protein T439DRAFT_298786 [Meredithblackwellia eburnea MCA 4105]
MHFRHWRIAFFSSLILQQCPSLGLSIPLPVQQPFPVPPPPGQLNLKTSYEDGWYDPRRFGGSFLNKATPEKGEPLNIIISNRSSPDVLGEHGFIAYSRSLGLWNECANLHLGDAQFADLGDGQGWGTELYEMRESWHYPWIGSCLESVIGGNHFRAWKQNGTLANSGAWFLAASKEVDIRGNHMIIKNGYNIGRDIIVEEATRPEGTRYKQRTWQATVEYVEGLLPAGNEGVNHDISQDGRVAVLTVREY